MPLKTVLCRFVLPVFILVTTACVFDSFLQSRVYLKQLQLQSEATAHQHAAQLLRQLERSVDATMAVSAAVLTSETLLSLPVNSNVTTTSDLFDKLANFTIQRFASVSFATLSPMGVVSYVYPLKGNEAAVGLDAMRIPDRNALFAESVRLRGVAVSRPTPLVQSGVGLMMVFPIFSALQGTSGPLCDERFVAGCHSCESGRWWGMASTVTLLPQLLAAAGLTELPPKFQLSVVSATETIYSSAEDFVCDDPIPIQFANQRWMLHYKDDSGYPTQFWLSLCINAVVVVLIPSLVYAALHFFTAHLQQLRTSHERLQSAFAELKVAQQHQDFFLAAMSHEIRTPLNGLVGTLDAFHSAAPAMQAEMLSTMRQAADHLHMVINDILDFSKLKAGRLRLETETVEVRNLFTHCVDLFASSANEKNLDLDLEYESDFLLPVEVDGHRLQQVLHNLIGNAIKFTETGRILVTVTEEGDREMLSFEVRDTGIGIPGDVLPRLFMPFEQGNTGITQQFGGTGLGLCIVDEIVKLMQGVVTVQSRVGHGSSFCVRIPVKYRDNPSVAGAILPLPRDFVMLVVDDCRINRIVAENLGRSAGITVLSVCSGFECLALLDPTQAADTFSSEFRFTQNWLTEHCAFADAILMDVHMPLLDGLRTTFLLREQGCGVPVVLATADATSRLCDVAVELNIARVLTKPIRRDTLQRTLVEIFSSQNPHFSSGH